MILLVGASASGKTEIAKSLLQQFGMKKAITHTSRPMRTNEKEGVDYHFVSEEKFLSLWKSGQLLENIVYNHYHYGCSKQEIADDKCIILDPNGVNTFLASKRPHLVVFYLQCPKEVRQLRMQNRGDSKESIKARLASDDIRFDPKLIQRIDYQIDTSTSSPDVLADRIYSLYQKELKK